ncbi:MAG TPA: TMEM175 family protein [Chloroflexota bacterium]|nr:TMEM175 family protein [Chloroflexota bacterium]
MSSARLETFSDGVIAILITIMVLSLATPKGAGWTALRGELPLVLIYLLSFVFLGIYWSNHHHLFTMVERISGGVLWANLHLLFWLSLIPFATRWLGEQGLEALPTAAYGFVGLMAAIAYFILLRVILRQQQPDSDLARAVGRDFKGKLSALAYLVAAPLAFVASWGSVVIYVGVALLWLIPDRRIESRLTSESTTASEAHPSGGIPPG